jgi:phospholipase/carboxylesterase
MQGLSYVAREPRDGNARHRPTLILLHGFALYERHLLDLTQGFDPRLHIVAVRAPHRIGPGAYRWYQFEPVAGGPSRIDAAEAVQSLMALAKFLDALTAEREPKGLYLLGHSQGGAMALSLALTRPRQIAGCANVNSRILPEISSTIPSREDLIGLPFFVGHGVEDPVIPIANGRATRKRLEELQVKLSYREYPVGHDITAHIMADVSDWLSARLDERERAV